MSDSSEYEKIRMLFSDEWRSIGWRFAVGGPLFVGIGIYLWPRGDSNRPTDA